MPKETDNRGVVSLHNLPHGFNEVTMFQYFKQFGRISRLRLSRSAKVSLPLMLLNSQ